MRIVTPSYLERNITLPDGYSAYARIWKAQPCRGALLYFHGIQSHCGWYKESARRACQAGFTVLQPDRRGSGRNSEHRGHADSAQQLIDDAAACANLLLQEAGTDGYHLLGVSWGGKLATALHVQQPDNTLSMVLVTPGLFPKVGVSPSQMMRIGFSMVSAPHKLYDIPLNDPQLFTQVPDAARFIERDQLQIHQATAGFYLASRRMDKVCQRLGEARPVPTHLMLAGDERIIDNSRTRAFVRALHQKHTLITTYQHSRHTLEFDPDREAYFDDLLRWLQDPAGCCRDPAAVIPSH